MRKRKRAMEPSKDKNNTKESKKGDNKNKP